MSTGEFCVCGEWESREVTGVGRGIVSRILSRTQPPATLRVLEEVVGVFLRRVKSWISEVVRFRVLEREEVVKSCWGGLLEERERRRVVVVVRERFELIVELIVENRPFREEERSRLRRESIIVALRARSLFFLEEKEEEE